MVKVPEVLHRPMSEKISDPTFVSQSIRGYLGCVYIPIHLKVFIVIFVFLSVSPVLHAQLVSEKIDKHFVYSLESRKPLSMKR